MSLVLYHSVTDMSDGFQFLNVRACSLNVLSYPQRSCCPWFPTGEIIGIDGILAEIRFLSLIFFWIKFWQTFQRHELTSPIPQHGGFVVARYGIKLVGFSCLDAAVKDNFFQESNFIVTLWVRSLPFDIYFSVSGARA